MSSKAVTVAGNRTTFKGLERPPKILYMIDEMESITAGGTERQILQMIHLMREAGADMHLCILRGTRWLSDEQAGCPVHFCDIPRVLSLEGLCALSQLRRWIKVGDFDIVQSFFIESNLIGPPLARLAGVKAVVGSRRNLNQWMTPTFAFAQRVSNWFVSILLANCESVRDTVSRTEGFPMSKIRVIYNGLDIEHLTPSNEDRAQVRHDLGVGEDTVLIGNISTLRAVKRIPEFVRAAALVHKQRPETRFIVVGDGPERAKVEQAIRDEKLDEHFHLIGSREDIRPYLAAIDIGVLNSESEGLSNTILEYIAASLPCVVTDVGGNREAAGDAGLVVRVGDVNALATMIDRLAGDQNERKRLRVQAGQQAAKFRLDHVQNDLEQWYCSLLSRADERNDTL